MGKLYRYRIGTGIHAITYDESKYELEVGGLRVDIQLKPLQVLSALLRKSGEIVTREELFADVWHGRPTVENVLPNAITKLRNALGPENAGLIENTPRVGYRFTGHFERVAVGQDLASGMALAEGQSVPNRPSYRLQRLLGRSHGYEAWLARHRESGDLRVYKFAEGAQALAGLKREATLSRVLRDRLGERPDIVRMVDWSFDESPFFLESEYGGENLLEWHRSAERLKSLDERARLDLFLKIAGAVAAAHSVGVLHKDIKPANILVAADGDTWQVRLADFGSGRLIDPDRIDQLGITALGMTVADGLSMDATRGTLIYAAPELFRDQPATIRSDVYSLGVLLFQIMAGDLDKFLVTGWERDIPNRFVRDDIVRATDGDPEMRTGSVDQLIQDLQRIEVRADAQALESARGRELAAMSARLGRIRARRPWVTATVASLLAGLAISLTFYAQARRAQSRLAADNVTVTALNRFLTDDLVAAANPTLTGRSDFTMIEAAKRAAGRIDGRFAADPHVRASLHEAMQHAFDGLADYASAITEGNAALDSWMATQHPDRGRIAEIHALLAVDLAEMSSLPAAAEHVEAADESIPRPDGDESVLGAEVWWARARVASIEMVLPAAVESYRRAWEILKATPAAPAELTDRVEFQFADANKMLFHFDSAAAQFEDLLATQNARYGAKHPLSCYTRLALANTLGYTSRSLEAMPLAQSAAACLDETLGPSSARTLTAHDIVGGLYFLQGRYPEAAHEWQLVVDQFARAQGPVSLRAINLRLNLATARQYAGDPETAASLFAATLADARKTFDERHPLVQSLRYHTADCLLDLHRTQGVRQLLDNLSVDALRQSQLNPDWDARLAYQQGRLALQSGDRARAFPLLDQAARIIAAKNPEGRISEAVVRKLMSQAQ